MYKDVLCLANSRKLEGRCVAGKEVMATGPGDWIRPVSDRDKQEVSERERQYENGEDPRVLDVISIPLLAHQPRGCQTENWLLDPQAYWVKRRQATWPEAARFVDSPGPLWVNEHSTFNGRNDRVPLPEANELESSLRLIRVDNLALDVFAPGEAFGNSKRRVQGCFNHARVDYAMWVTDPGYERSYLNRPNGRYSIGECLLTISLGEPYQGFCYKLIAAIIERH